MPSGIDVTVNGGNSASKYMDQAASSMTTTVASPLLPEAPIQGRCQCPNDPITYLINEPPQSLNVCYCHECQRQSGSAFALTLVVPSSGLLMNSRSIVNLQKFERRTESGGIRGGVFCGRCGVRLWHFNPIQPEWSSVKAGTLDTKVDFGAAQHIWTKRMLHGMEVPGNAQAYEEEPVEGPI